MMSGFPDVSDGFILKMTSDLDSVLFVYHTDTTDSDFYYDFIIDSTFYVCGGKANYCCDDTNYYNKHGLLRRLNADYSIDSSWFFGGDYIELFQSMQELEGYLYLFGTTNSYTTEPPGQSGSDPYVVKCKKNGEFVWEKHPGTTAFDALSDATLDAGGQHFLCAGGSGPNVAPDPYYDGMVLKLDTAANVTWRKTFKTGALRDEYFTSITATPDGGGLAAGYATEAGIWITAPYFVRFNENGDTLWTKLLYRFDEPYESAYNKRWGNSEVWDALRLASGDFVFTGDWDNQVQSTRDIFICKYSADGDSLWRIDLGDGWLDKGYCITEDDDGYIYVAGSYANTSLANGGRDVLLIKLDANGCTVDTCLVSSLLQTQTVSTNPFSLYPNPADESIRIELSNPLSQQGTQLVVRDLNSRVVLHQAVSNHATVSVESLSAGVYIAELLQRNGERYYKRFVKQ